MHRTAFLVFFTIAAHCCPFAAATGLCAQVHMHIAPCGFGGGGRFTALAVSPHNPEIVLAGSDVAGVFKSNDGGRQFHLTGEHLEGFAVADIMFHPAVPRQVFLLTNDGLYLSLDDGETWRKKSSQINYRERIAGSSLMVLFKNEVWIAAGTQGIYKITTSASGPCIIPVPGLEKTAARSLAVCRGIIFAATGHGIYRHENNRWVSCNAGLPPENVDITNIFDCNNDRLYAVEKTAGMYVWNSEKYLWVSREMGLLNRYISRPKAFKAIAVSPANPGCVLIATHPDSWPHVLFASKNGGQTWSAVSSFNPDAAASDNWAIPKTNAAIEDLAFSPRRPDQVYLADWWNIWKSTDSGQSWHQLHNGLQNTVINDIKVSPRDALKLYLSVCDTGLMISRDGGKTWSRSMAGVIDGHARELEISRQNPARLYLLMNPWEHDDHTVYVYTSSDDGSSWQNISFTVPVRTVSQKGFVSGLATNIEIDPSDDTVVYVGTNGHGVFKTTDSGLTWEAADSGIRTPFIDGPGALCIHPLMPATIFAGTLKGGICKSTNAGKSWEHVFGKNTFIYGMAIDPANPHNIIACGANKQIFLSGDEGRTWKEQRLPGRQSPLIAAYAVAFQPARPRSVFIGTLSYQSIPADGLFLSTDGGASFAPCPLRLPMVNINTLAAPPDRGKHVYIGFSGTGLFRGTTLQQEDNENYPVQ